MYPQLGKRSLEVPPKPAPGGSGSGRSSVVFLPWPAMLQSSLAPPDTFNWDLSQSPVQRDSPACSSQAQVQGEGIFSFLNSQAVRMLCVLLSMGMLPCHWHQERGAKICLQFQQAPSGKHSHGWGELKGFYNARGLQKYHFQSDPASAHASWLMASISQNKGGLWEKLGVPWTTFWEHCPAESQPNQHTNHISGPSGSPCSCPDAWLYPALCNSSHLGRFF